MIIEYKGKSLNTIHHKPMGIDDEDFYKAQAVCSNSQLYKQAGNGIVVDVFAAILKNLF